MAIDKALVGSMAADLLDKLETEYSEDAELTAAGVVVAIDNGDGQKFVRYDFAPDLAPYEAIGLLEYVKRHLG